MNYLQYSVATYTAIKERLRTNEPDIDERTLADTVEGLTDLNDILEAIIRSALVDEALSKGLKGRISEMQGRLERLEDRASKRRQIAKDVMVQLNLKSLSAPDFTVSVRDGMPSLQVLAEDQVPSIYWAPGTPRLKRKELTDDLKRGSEIAGVTLSDGQPVISVRVR